VLTIAAAAPVPVAATTGTFSPTPEVAAAFCGCLRPLETLSEGAVLLATEEAWLAGTWESSGLAGVTPPAAAPPAMETSYFSHGRRAIKDVMSRKVQPIGTNDRGFFKETIKDSNERPMAGIKEKGGGESPTRTLGAVQYPLHANRLGVPLHSSFELGARGRLRWQKLDLPLER
jgi:hypothetical protein